MAFVKHYLYMEATLKIKNISDNLPTNGQIAFLYAQLQPESAQSAESWSCSITWQDLEIGKTPSGLLLQNYFGTQSLDTNRGNYLTLVEAEKTETTAWTVEPDKSEINYLGDSYSYKCSVYRSLKDPLARH